MVTGKMIGFSGISRFYKSFYPPNTSLEDGRRLSLHITLSFIGIIFLLLFCCLALIQKNAGLALADFTAILLLTGNLYDLHKRKKTQFNIFLGLVFVSLLYVFLYVTGGTSKSAFVWY